jgi:hypothetical protein
MPESSMSARQHLEREEILQQLEREAESLRARRPSFYEQLRDAAQETIAGRVSHRPVEFKRSWVWRPDEKVMPFNCTPG